MSHLESLIAEYLEWQGYLIRKNTKVGRLSHGGWAMELDIVAYLPATRDLVHYEPSIDAKTWPIREARFRKKFQAGRKYITKDVFPWLPKAVPLRQVAVFPGHPEGRDRIAGGSICSIDELMAEIKGKVLKEGPMHNGAIPEQFPLLRTIQMALSGYHRVKAISAA